MSTKKIILTILLIIMGTAGIYFTINSTHFINTFAYNSWRPMGSGFYRGHMMMGGFMHLFFWFIILYFIASTIGGRRTAVAYSTDSASEILKKRFINEEISQTEFTEKMNLLNKGEQR